MLSLRHLRPLLKHDGQTTIAERVQFFEVPATGSVSCLNSAVIAEWQPRNVLESQIIDAICQAQTIREY